MLQLLKNSMKPAIRRSLISYYRNQTSRDQVTVLCPPIPSENLGDQAMVLGAVNELSRRELQNWQLVKTGPQFDVSDLTIQSDRLADHHLFFCSSEAFREETNIVRELAKTRMLIVFGADVLDGKYGSTRFRQTFRAIQIAIDLGVPVRLIGFSVSDDPADEAVELLRDLSSQIEVYPRDPVTYRRLQEFGIRNLTQAADVAFLMPAANEQDLSEKSREYFASQSLRPIGVSLHYNFFEKSDIDLMGYMAKALSELSSVTNRGFLFVPHHPLDVSYHQKLKDRLNREVVSRSFFVDALPTAPVAKRMFAECEHVLTSRMHVTIASLSSTVPVTCFPYYGKFEGLFEHYQMNSDGMISPEEFPDEPSKLAARLLQRINDSGSERNHIEQRTPAIVEMSRSNFEVS